MKNLTYLILATLLLAPTALFGAAFEGKVSFKVTTGKDSFDMIQSVKGDLMRNETTMAKGSGAAIIDMKKLQTIIIMDEMKMFMTIDMNKAAEKVTHDDEVKVEKTSETEKIAGYTATKYLATSKDGVTETWMTEALGGFAMPASNPMGGKSSAPPAWARAFAGKALFPLRVVTKDKKGKETYRMEATAVEKQKLPDSLFTVPEGYQQFSMGNMMKGLIPGFGR